MLTSIRATRTKSLELMATSHGCINEAMLASLYRWSFLPFTEWVSFSLLYQVSVNLRKHNVNNVTLCTNICGGEGTQLYMNASISQTMFQSKVDIAIPLLSRASGVYPSWISVR